MFLLAKFRYVRISTTKVAEYLIGANIFQKNNQFFKNQNQGRDYH